MDKIKQLENIAKVLGTYNVITKDEFNQVIKSVADVLKVERENIKGISEEYKQTLQSVINTISEEHDKVLQSVENTSQTAKSEATEAITKALEEVKRIAKEVMEMKPKDGEHGLDADEEIIVEKVLGKIVLPEYKETVLDGGEQIRDKLSLLKGNERLDISAVKGAEKLTTQANLDRAVSILDQRTQFLINKVNTSTGGGGGTPEGSDTQLQYNNAGAFGGISGATTNGTTVTYTTGNLVAHDVKASQSAGIDILSNNGIVTALFGAGGGANSTFYGGSKFDYATASTVPYFDASKNLISSAVTPTELGYLSGVTSAIQTQLNAKGTFTLPALTAGSVLFSDGSTIAQDNANFFWDNTNNRLGIGTASPTYSLEVAGTFKSGTGSVIGSPSAGGVSLTVRSSTGDPTTSVLAVNDESNNNLFRVHSEASGSTKMSTALVLIDNTLRVGDKLQIAGQLFSVRIDQVTPADSKLTVKAGDANYDNRGGGDLDFQSGAGAGAGDGGAISFYTSLGIASSGVTNTQIKRASILPSGSVLIETPSSGVALDVRGSILGQKLVEANTAGSGSPNIITSAESGTVFTNEGTTAQNYHTLPTAAAGLTYTFYVDDADGIRVTANTGDIIQINGVASTTAGYCESLTIGSSITLLAINATDWVATSSVGTWNLA